MKAKMRHRDPSSFGDAVIAGLEDLAGQIERGEKLTADRVRLEIPRKAYRGRKIRSIRKGLGLSQPLFARFIGTSSVTVRSWEQDVRTPSPMACRFMEELERAPEHWKQRIHESLVANPSGRR